MIKALSVMELFQIVKKVYLCYERDQSMRTGEPGPKNKGNIIRLGARDE